MRHDSLAAFGPTGLTIGLSHGEVNVRMNVQRSRAGHLALALALLGMAFPISGKTVEQPLAATNAPTAWWNKNWQYRVPVTVKAAGTEEVDAPVQVRLNFSGLLKAGERLDEGQHSSRRAGWKFTHRFSTPRSGPSSG